MPFCRILFRGEIAGCFVRQDITAVAGKLVGAGPVGDGGGCSGGWTVGIVELAREIVSIVWLGMGGRGEGEARDKGGVCVCVWCAVCVWWWWDVGCGWVVGGVG